MDVIYTIMFMRNSKKTVKSLRQALQDKEYGCSTVIGQPNLSETSLKTNLVYVFVLLALVVPCSS